MTSGATFVQFGDDCDIQDNFLLSEDDCDIWSIFLFSEDDCDILDNCSAF